MNKTIRVRQRDISDCGAACLASVAAYYKLQIPVSRIRQYAGTDRSGTSLYGLIEAAEKLNFQAKGAKAKTESMQSIPLPAVFHTVLKNGNQHFVVVYKVKRRSILYMDPAIGKMVSESVADFKTAWSGVVMLLLPSENFRPGNEKTSAFTRFSNLIKPHGRLLTQALTGALVYTVLGLSTSIYVQKIVDFVLPDANKPLINLLSVIMIVLLTFQVVIGYLKSMIALRTGQQIDIWLILGYYKHLLELPQRFFDSMRVGEIISRVNDAVRIRIFINDVALSLVVHALTIMLSMTVMFIYNWKLAMIMAGTIPVYALIYIASNRMNEKSQREMMECGAALESQLVETVQGVTTIRRFGAGAYFNQKTENRFIPFMRTIFRSSQNGLLVSNVSEWITHLLTVSILWAGSYLVISRVLSPGELLSFYTLTAFFSTPVQALIGANRPMQDALIAADRLFEIIDLETEKDSAEKLVIRQFPEGNLVFRNIFFGYGESNPVFSGLQLSIARNQMTAIIGESGCGKSTLLSLLQKLYPLQAGDIVIGETAIQHLSTSVLRHHIVAVPQHTDIFEGDFISNVCLGEENPDFEKIVDLFQRLGLHEFISRLPGKYHTIIREQGMNLSGGQKQRIGIARAMYRNPSILVLDEATSSLDPESERRVQATLRWFFGQKKTIIVIAHRLSTIKYCDTIVYLRQDGKAVSGTHEKLMAEDKDYASWWQTGVLMV